MKIKWQEKKKENTCEISEKDKKQGHSGLISIALVWYAVAQTFFDILVSFCFPLCLTKSIYLNSCKRFDEKNIVTEQYIKTRESFLFVLGRYSNRNLGPWYSYAL